MYNIFSLFIYIHFTNQINPFSATAGGVAQLRNSFADAVATYNSGGSGAEGATSWLDEEITPERRRHHTEPFRRNPSNNYAAYATNHNHQQQSQHLGANGLVEDFFQSCFEK